MSRPGGRDADRSGPPRWAVALLRRLAPAARRAEVVGDLEEAHRRRAARRGGAAAGLVTGLEALDMGLALLRERVEAGPLGRRARGRGPGAAGPRPDGPLPRVSWLDFKLGLRMLVKHPGITVLGVLAMAFGIFVGAGAFEFVRQVVLPTLPLPGGDRVVAIRVWDAAESRSESRVLYDLSVWKGELESVEELGAFDTAERNLVTADGRSGPVTAAAMEASGFRVAAVPPLLGRHLVDDDALPGAPPVVVLGHGAWASRFDRDPEVVGTVVRLGGTPTTVVGVMPEGFAFPVSHEAWVPFTAGAVPHEPRTGPTVTVFGRLAEGASLDEVETELQGIRERLASAHPSTHAHLRVRALPYARAFLGPFSLSSAVAVGVGLASNIPLVLFLALVCGNVALLLFARAATREGEMVVRSALGASRGRLVAQLFVEALVLAALAAALGLAAAQYGLGWVLRITETIVLEGAALPFWFHASLSPATLLYAALLALLAAAVAGVLPGLRVTRDLGARLQRASAGAGGFRFGGVWTVVIAGQIAVTMLFPVLTLATRAQRDQEMVEELELDSERYLAARLEMDRSEEPPGPGADEGGGDRWLEERFRPAVTLLRERLEAEPRVAGVTFAERLPRQYHPWRQVEVEGPAATPRDERGHRLSSATVTLDYFDVMGAAVVAGRGFRPADLGDGPGVVVVNQSFVERILGGRNAVGRRIRYLATEEYRNPDQDAGPWHEIVGVVEDLGTRSGYGLQGMYHPAADGALYPVQVAVRVRGDADDFAPVLRSVAAGVDARLRLDGVISLDQVTRGQEEFFAFWTTLLVTVSALGVLLSLGGIFAVMSYTVARRTREIGIRVALGSSRARVVAAIFRRPLAQVGIGVLSGGLLLVGLLVAAAEGVPDLPFFLGVAVYMAVAGAVCLLACVVPTARALAVEPGEALRIDG